MGRKRSKEPGAIPELIILVFGIFISVVFGVPDETGIGIMILKAFSDALCKNNTNPACNYIPIFQVILVLIGIFAIIGSIISIYTKFQKGRYF